MPAADELEESSWSADFGRRFVPEAATPPPVIGTGRVAAWMRVTAPLDGDDLLHRCWLAYLSDDLPCDAVIRAHPDRAAIDAAEDRFVASLDHSVLVPLLAVRRRVAPLRRRRAWPTPADGA